MTEGELILYTAEDGSVAIQLRAEGGTVWITQLELAALFQTTKQNISLHIKNILAEGELDASVVKEYLTTAADGKNYKTKSYNLDMILAVGYRVRSLRGTQFRQWATTHLREYLVKGFVLDDARLKEPGGWDYFDELLARIREIRASEKRFYQKIRDIYATAVDYDPQSDQAQLFFKKVQNKMLWAITRSSHTALNRTSWAMDLATLVCWPAQSWRTTSSTTLRAWRPVSSPRTGNERQSRGQSKLPPTQN